MKLKNKKQIELEQALDNAILELEKVKKILQQSIRNSDEIGGGLPPDDDEDSEIEG